MAPHSPEVTVGSLVVVWQIFLRVGGLGAEGEDGVGGVDEPDLHPDVLGETGEREDVGPCGVEVLGDGGNLLPTSSGSLSNWAVTTSTSGLS